MLHFLFNGWIIYNSKYSLTSVCVYYLNYESKVINYLITLLEQLSRHIRINYAAVISNILAHFKVTKESLSCFITNNIKNNNTYIDYLTTIFNFRKDNWHIQYIAYILNFITQLIIFRKDKDIYKNNQDNILVSQ